MDFLCSIGQVPSVTQKKFHKKVIFLSDVNIHYDDVIEKKVSFRKNFFVEQAITVRRNKKSSTEFLPINQFEGTTEFRKMYFIVAPLIS